MFFALCVVNWLSSLHSPWLIDTVVDCVSSCEQRLHLEEDARVMSIWSWLEFQKWFRVSEKHEEYTCVRDGVQQEINRSGLADAAKSLPCGMSDTPSGTKWQLSGSMPIEARRSFRRRFCVSLPSSPDEAEEWVLTFKTKCSLPCGIYINWPCCMMYL